MKLFSALERSPTQKRVVIADLNSGFTLRDGLAFATRVEPEIAIAPAKSSRRVKTTANLFVSICPCHPLNDIFVAIVQRGARPNRLRSKADIRVHTRSVRFIPNADMFSVGHRYPLSAMSRSRGLNREPHRGPWRPSSLTRYINGRTASREVNPDPLAGWIIVSRK